MSHQFDHNTNDAFQRLSLWLKNNEEPDSLGHQNGQGYEEEDETGQDHDECQLPRDGQRSAFISLPKVISRDAPQKSKTQNQTAN